MCSLNGMDEFATHGGSLRIYMTHASSARVPSPRVNDLLEHEINKDLLDIETYARVGEQVGRSKRSLLSFLIACKEQGKRVCGFGATGAAVSFLNAYDIGADFLDFTVDPDPIKHGRFTPGLHIPIRPVAAIDEAMPDYLLVLPWVPKIEIVRELRHVGAWGCRFIVPPPEIQLIDPSPSQA
jgi:C-methyltransferase C-terminal domain